jgi:hypothetical protein
MKITSVAPGSKFVVVGNEYTLYQIPNEGGYQWLGKDGKYALAQAFYFHDDPSPEDIESMQKHLLPFEALGREEGIKRLAVGPAPHIAKSVREIIAQLDRASFALREYSLNNYEGMEKCRRALRSFKYKESASAPLKKRRAPGEAKQYFNEK